MSDPVPLTPRQYSSDDEIAQIAEGMLARTLPKARWTHEAHFASVVYLLERRADIDIDRALPDLIRRYNESQGGQNTDTAGYHETITRLYLGAIRFFLATRRRDEPMVETVNDLVRSEWASRTMAFSYYTKSRILAPRARREWIEPDLAELPFEVVIPTSEPG